MEPIKVKCPICDHSAEIRIAAKGQTVHRCKKCQNLVKIVKDESKPSKNKKTTKKKSKKKTSRKKRTTKKSSDEK